MNDVGGTMSLGSSMSFDEFYILSTQNWTRICNFVHKKIYTPPKIVQGFAIFFIKIAHKKNYNFVHKKMYATKDVN